MKLFYLEAGSGASQHIPPEMIAKIKKFTDLIVIVGGGIRDGTTAAEVAKAGADIIVTGTVVEHSSKVEDKIKELVTGIRSI